MTDEEFQRIKDHEKARLRAKKRLQETMRTLKRDERVQEVVRSMSDAAGRLLRDSTALIDDLRTEVARKTARLSVALDPSDLDTSSDVDASPSTDEMRPDDLEDDVEAEDRRARAEALVRQMKAQGRRSTRRRSSANEATDAASESEDAGEASDDLPERTIGRMRDEAPRDAS